jgi:hypothetical protein
MILTIKPDNAERLMRLEQITSLPAEALLNSFLAWYLAQIIDEGDADLLQGILQPLRFSTKEEALLIIARYEEFAALHGDRSALAQPMRERNGDWRIAFKQTF